MTAANTAVPPPRRRRFRWLMLRLLLIVGGLFVARLVYQSSANERLLRDAIAEIEATDPHWRIEAIEANRTVVPDAENSANIIQKLGASLGGPPGAVIPPRPLRALPDAPPPTMRLTDEQYREIVQFLGENKVTIDDALSLALHPRGRPAVPFAPNTRMTPGPHGRDVDLVYRQLLRPYLLAKIQEGDATGAVHACRAILNLGRSFGDEPSMYSQRERGYCCVQTVRSLERLLGQGEVPDAMLAALQAALAEEAAYDPWVIALRGTRATTPLVLEAVRQKQLSARVFSRPQPRFPQLGAVRDKIQDWIPPDTRPDSAWMLRFYNRLLELAPMDWHQRRSAFFQMLATDFDDIPDFDGGFVGNVSDLVRGSQYIVAHSHCGVTALAVERYRLRHGSWPDSLAVLAPDLLTVVPADPFDGQPLRYRRLLNGVVIYSVGDDGKNDGGNMDSRSQLMLGTDLGFHLWDLPYRSQQPEVPR